MAKTKKQPAPKKGFKFIGWATFNWGVCHDRVYRTRRDAIHALTHGENGEQLYKWADMKSYMKVVKVECIVL